MPTTVYAAAAYFLPLAILVRPNRRVSVIGPINSDENFTMVVGNCARAFEMVLAPAPVYSLPAKLSPFSRCEEVLVVGRSLKACVTSTRLIDRETVAKEVTHLLDRLL